MIELEGGATRVLRVVERTFLVLAGVLLAGYTAVHLSSAAYQADSARELERMRAPGSTTSGARTAPAAPAAGSLIGRIQLPRLGLSAIVSEGDDETTLRRAVGHIPRTALPGEPGNVGLAGHRDTFFRKLKDVRAGDQIIMKAPGKVYEYVVRETRVVEPTDVSVLEPTTARVLTLVTCYPFSYIGAAPKRFIVRAEVIARQP
jgi:sortase A